MSVALKTSVDDSSASTPAMDSGSQCHKGPLLLVENLCVSLAQRNQRLTIVSQLSCRLHAGETLAIIGESGSGKTMAARALIGLLPHAAICTGSVCVDGEDLLRLSPRELRKRRGRAVAMVFQDSARALNPTMKIGQQIAEAVVTTLSVDRATGRVRAMELLKELSFPVPLQQYHLYPHELSGGLRQRVMIAIALAGNPRVLIADEATRSLDAIVQQETLHLLKSLQERHGMALILISHDLRLARQFADSVLVMYAGRAVEVAPVSALFSAPRMRYTESLIHATPFFDTSGSHQELIASGAPPDLTALPTGCAFAPRCRWNQDRCRSETPSLLDGGDGRSWACFFPAANSGQQR